jgi:predicted ATPase
MDVHPDLIVASGYCNAHTGVGDPYLPFREILALICGDVQALWSAGAITRRHALRLWEGLPLAAQALVEAGPDLVNTFVPGPALVERVLESMPSETDWLSSLSELVEHRKPGTASPRPQQSDLFRQFTRVLQVLARRTPIVLVVDDLQWADLGSISLLFHLGRNLAGSRLLVIGSYRPEEVALGRGDERHPLERVVSEFQREFGDILVDLSRTDRQRFVDALVDSEPNQLGPAFRQMLLRQTNGHPLFTVELLRGMQERGDLVQDTAGRWVEGPSLQWEALPARVVAVIAERIGRLAGPLQAVLRVASVEGQVFTAEIAARVLATEEREILARLSNDIDRKHRLIRAHTITRVDGQRLSRFRFRHILYQKYLYGNLGEVERVYLHEQVGTTLEELHGLQEETGASLPVAVQLAHHFQEAKIAAKAIHYLHQAGDKAVQLSAYQEGIDHLIRGLDLLMSRSNTPQRARKELDLQLSLGLAWTGDKGTMSVEVFQIYTRARELCQILGEKSQLCRVLGGLSLYYYTRAQHQQAYSHAKEALILAEWLGDPLLVMLGDWYMGFITFSMGQYKIARVHLERVVASYEPDRHHHSLLTLRGSDPGPSAMAYLACCLWSLGFPDKAQKHSQEALAMARVLGHPFSLVDVVCYAGCMLSSMRRDAKTLKETADELIRVSAETLPPWLVTGTPYLGQALAMLGQVEEGAELIREGIESGKAQDVRCYHSGALCGLAEVQAKKGSLEEAQRTVAEALEFIEETGERHWEAELYRLKGVSLLMLGDEVRAEVSLLQAIEVARGQRARSWELRATTSLCRLWQRQGRHDQARQMLEEIYDWFTEGHDTPDLREAKALLDSLSRPVSM